MGCGCLTAGIVALLVISFSWAMMTRPVEPEVVTLEASDSFEPSIQESTLNLPEGQTDPSAVKPVRLKIKASMARITIRPGEPNGKIGVEGNYDRANFDLNTEVEDRGDHIDYRIELDSKRTMFGRILNGGLDSRDIENEVIITLPPNLLLELETDLSIGDFELDLSGLALSSLKLRGSMGQYRVSMAERNQVEMEMLDVQFSTGDMRVHDYQNMRFSKLKSDMSMGSMRFTNSGPLEKDISIKAEGSLGEVYFDVPENVKVDSSASVFMGEFRGVRQEKGYLPDDAPVVKFRGDMTMGEMSVRQRTAGEDITTLVLKWIRAEGLDAAVAKYKTLLKDSPTKYNYDPSAINVLGYRLLRSERTRALAIDVFIFNTLVHPYYANGFDSLGEGYLEIGDKELALKNYRIAYEMDPSNTNAYRIVERLESEISNQDQDQDTTMEKEN